MIRLAVVPLLLVSLFAVAAPPVAGDAQPPRWALSADGRTDGVGITPTATLDAAFHSVAAAFHMSATAYILGQGSKGFKVDAATSTAPKAVTDMYRVSLEPKLVLSPTEGWPETRVTIKGYRFTANSTLALTQTKAWGGTTNLTLQTSSGEAFSAPIAISSGGSFGYNENFAITFVVPSTATDRPTTIEITDAAGNSAIAIFMVIARPLMLSKTSGPRGTKLRVSSTSLEKSGEIDPHGVNSQVAGANGDLTLEGTRLIRAGESITTDSTGTFLYNITVPSTAAIGTNEVKAVDSGGAVAKGTFTVTEPNVSLSPEQPVKGGRVAVIGSGFAPSIEGTITIQAVGNTTLPFSTDPQGNFQSMFTVGAAASSSLLFVKDAYENSAWVILRATTASLALSPATFRPGDVVTATGIGFDGNAAVKIGANDPTVTANLLTDIVYTDSSGNFTATFAVPNLAEGYALIYAKAGSTTASRAGNVREALETVSIALARISGKVTIVWGFDATTQTWKKYDQAAPAVSDLTKFEKGKGYWIRVTDNVTLVYGAGTYALTAGWNLIGWLGQG